MTELQGFTQLGVAGITLAILFFIVRYFVDAMKAKDEHIYSATKEFTKVVGNHIDHSTKAMSELNKTLERNNDQQTNILSVLDSNTRMLGKMYELERERRNVDK